MLLGPSHHSDQLTQQVRDTKAIELYSHIHVAVLSILRRSFDVLILNNIC